MQVKSLTLNVILEILYKIKNVFKLQNKKETKWHRIKRNCNIVE